MSRCSYKYKETLLRETAWASLFVAILNQFHEL